MESWLPNRKMRAEKRSGRLERTSWLVYAVRCARVTSDAAV